MKMAVPLYFLQRLRIHLTLFKNQCSILYKQVKSFH